MNISRRNLCQTIGGLLGLWSLSGCSQPAPAQPVRTYTEEEQRRMHKFRGVSGGGTLISGFGATREEGVFAVIKEGGRHIFEEGLFWEGKNSISSFRIYPPGLMKFMTVNAYASRGGPMLYEVSVPVADRIPDDLLDDLRRDPKGGLRIKIRLHREGVLLGWDIERRPGFDPKKRDSYGEIAYVAPVHSFAGGDFREAEIYNGKAVRKGWYIHPKTGERIETDF